MKRIFAVAVLGVSILATPAAARDEIKVVGSSTVFPFTVAVAERLANKGVEIEVKSTGTRAGFAAFCLGYGDWWPDVSDASRKIRESEVQSCFNRGVDGITELKIGYDGIVLARNASTSELNLSRKDLFLALADRIVVNGTLTANPHASWRSVNSEAPDQAISVYGPPVSSGTRDSFHSLAMSAGCKQASENAPIPEDLSDLNYCTAIRGAPHYIEAGEDDAQIVQVLKENANAFGIFGYSYAATNPTVIRPVSIDGVLPSPQNIAEGRYPLSRPLFIYVKNSRLREVPNLKFFLEEYVSDAALGPDGYLSKIGLVPLSADELKKSKEAVRKLLLANGAVN